MGLFFWVGSPTKRWMDPDFFANVGVMSFRRDNQLEQNYVLSMIFWTLRIFRVFGSTFLVGWELITSRYVNWRWQWAVKKQGDPDPYIFTLRIVYDASPSIWLERGSPQDIQTPLEKVFQEVFGCARIVKASKDCNKHSQAFHVGVSTVCKNLRIIPGFWLIFCWSSSIPSKGYQSLCWTQNCPKRDSRKKNMFVFAKKKSWERKTVHPIQPLVT